MSNQIQLAVHGAAGRMGCRVTAAAAADPDIEIVAAIENPVSDHLGTDAGTLAGIAAVDVPISDRWPNYASAVIDFSLPSAAEGVITKCLAAEMPLVMATTGLDEMQVQQLQNAASEIPIVFAPSMSMTVNLAMKMAADAAAKLANVPGGLDVEIIERHHRHKADAPSGTALRFGQLIADAIQSATDATDEDTIDHVHGRYGEVGARPRNEIGYHAVRVGDNPGEHTIVLGMLGERIEINVAASNRDCYATGAIAAAKWIQGKPPGIYDMFDVLGI